MTTRTPPVGVPEERAAPTLPEMRFWVVWAPKAQEPPTATFTSEKQARRVAARMAEHFPGRAFMVLEVLAVSVHTPDQGVVTVDLKKPRGPWDE